MKSKKPNGMAKTMSAALSAGAIATLAFLPQARGELVYEDQAQPGANQAPELSRSDDRESLRQALSSSEQAKVTVQQTQLVAQAAPVAQVQSTEIEHLSKSELMRRERVRHELKNEDILQERLEELRLRDERRRTDQLLGVQGEAEAPAAQVQMSEQAVVAPVTERPGQQPAQVQVVQAPIARDQMVVSQSAVSTDAAVVGEEKTQMFVTPRVGMSTLADFQGFTVQSRYSAGVGFGVGVSDNLAFDLGYTYAEYGVNYTSSNPYVYNVQAYTGVREAIMFKQNVIDAGLRLFLLGETAKFRPFVGGGGSYNKSFTNFDNRIQTTLAQNGGQSLMKDYETTSFMGYVSTGADLRLSKSISVGALFKYYTVFSARSNGAAMNGAALGNYGGYYGAYNAYNYAYAGAYYDEAAKQLVGNALAAASFYSVTAGVNFTF